MASPFPGMDPYLEDQGLWRSFHTDFLVTAKVALNRDLPPDFAAVVEDYCEIAPTERPIVPDVAVVREPVGIGAASQSQPSGRADEPTGLALLAPDETDRHVAILSLRGSERVVAVIELLSPSNKDAHSRRHDDYLRKRAAIFDSDTHFVEIDLLRGGAHTVCVPRVQLDRHGPWDFVACVHRASQPDQAAYWLNRLRNPLPTIPIPLENGFSDVALNLQEVFTRCYDEGAYRRLLRYDRPLRLSLPADDAAWAQERLR